MTLSCANLKRGLLCANCGATLPDWGYVCDVCGALGCYDCAHYNRGFWNAHLHPQPPQMQQPPPPQQPGPQQASPVLQKAAQNDLSIATSSDPLAKSTAEATDCQLGAKKPPLPPEYTETHCPSCGWKRTESSADSKLAFLVRNGKEMNALELDRASAGAKQSHSVVPQSMIRDATREFLEQYKAAGPCGLVEPDIWPKLASDYKAYLRAAAAGRAEKDPASEIPKTKRFGTPTSNAGKIAEMSDAWKAPDEIAVPDDQLPITLLEIVRSHTANGALSSALIRDSKAVSVNGKVYTDVKHQLTEKDLPCEVSVGEKTIRVTVTKKTVSDAQNKARGDFASKFPTDRREKPETTENPSGTITVRVTVRGDSPGNEAVYTREIDRQGKTKSDQKQQFKDGQPQAVVDMTKAPKPEPPSFPGNVFNNMMRPSLMEGTQCDYCERIQGDFTLPQRCRYWETHQDSTPPEFVSLDLLKKIRDAGGIEKYMQAWLDNPVNELKGELERLCEESKKKQMEQEKQKAKEGAPSKGKKEAASQKEIDAAVEKALDDIMQAGDTVDSKVVMINAGKILAKANKSPDNDSMKEAVRTALDAKVKDGTLEETAKDKGNVSYRKKQ